MKKLKKFGFIIALCIAICLVLSFNGKTYATTFEKGAINLNEENKCTYTGWGDTIEYTFTPQKSEVYTFYSRGEEDISGQLYLGDNEIAYDNDSGEDYNFCIVKNLEAGKTYTFKIKMYSKNSDGKFSVFVKEETIESIEYTPSNEYILYENSNGSWRSSSDGRFFEYNFKHYSDGDILTITYKNGSKRQFTYFKDKSPSGFYDKNNEYIKTNTLDYIDSQYENHWEKGKENKLTIKYLHYFQTEVSVTIFENVVSSIEFNPIKPYKFFVNTNGYSSLYAKYDEDGKYLGNYSAWHYNWSYNVGDVLTVHYTNGTVKDYTYYYNDYQDYGFKSANGENLENVYTDNSQDTTPWTVGNDNSVTITYSGRTATVPVTILENPIEKLTFEPKKAVEIKEKTNGYWRKFNADKFFYYYVPSFSKGDKLIVKLKNGSTDVYTFYSGSKYGFYDEDGKIAEYEIRATSNQDTEHWSYGGDNNYYLVTFMGNEARVPVTITENPIISIDFQPTNNYYFIENMDGYRASYSVYDENGSYQETQYYFEYNLDHYPKFTIGDVLTVNYKDTSKGTVKYTYNSSRFKSDSGEEINPYDVKFISNQSEKHWTLGSENYLKVSYMDSSVDIPVSVIKNNVKSVQYIPAKALELTENCNGRTDTYEEYDEDSKTYITKEYYIYDTYSLIKQNGDKFIITYTDDSSETYTYCRYNPNEWYDFYTDDGKLLDSRYFSYSDNQSKTNRWAVGSDNNLITIKYAEKTTQLPVTINEHPIKSIEYIPVKSSFEEKTDGYFDGNYYNYNVYKKSGDKLIIHYKNGETCEFILGSYEVDYNNYQSDVYYNSRFKYINYNDVDYEDTQYTSHWTVGSENYCTITYMGIPVRVPITITPNSVSSIEYTPINPYQFNEYSNGYWATDTIWDYDEEKYVTIEYYRYNYSKFNNGDILTVHKTDGNTVEYTFGKYNDNDYYFKSEDGDIISQDSVIVVSSQSYNSPWTVGGNNYCTYTYKGSSVNVPVSIIGDDVESISYETQKNYEYSENTNGKTQNVRYFDEKTQKRVTVSRFIYDYGFIDGDILKVKLKNGETISYEYKDAKDNVKRGFYNGEKRLLADSDVTCSSDQFDATSWEPGEHYFTVKYRGKETNVKVTIIGENIDTECKHKNTEQTTSSKVTKKATPSQDGTITTLISVKCKDCNEIIEEKEGSKETIYRPETITIKPTSYTYDGKDKKPEIVVTDSNKKAISASHYTITFSNNKNVGKAKVTVVFKGNSYEGNMTKEFTIKSRSISKATISGISDKIYTGKAITQAITIKDGKTKLKLNTDYIIKYSSNINVGTVKVTITGKGNYNGSVNITFKINPQATKITKKVAGKKSFKISWKKISKETSGYQIQYTLDKKFKKNISSISINKNSTTSKNISKLSAKKKYFVRIRTYKKVGNKIYYSAWSDIANVTTKK